MRVLLVGPAEELPGGFEGLLAANDWSVDRAPDIASATQKVNDCKTDAIILSSRNSPSREADSFLRFVDSRRVAALVVGAESGGAPAAADSLIDLAGGNITKEELTRRLDLLTRFQSHLRRMERELERMQKLGKRLNQHFREIDDELRLASRLQRDFLPRDIKAIGPLHFCTVYRPASWVSGDIFDIQRLDEKHVGFYLADAVGHGMAAGLLTMFIKRSMVTKRLTGDAYELVEPGAVLQHLNDVLADQSLPNCQFVTGVYCLVNIETLVMRFARGGHPYPMLIGSDGRITELKSTGGLMGLSPDLECPTGQVQLQRGDKVLLYTDGFEGAFSDFAAGADDHRRGYRVLIESLARCGVSELVARLNEALDLQDGSLRPEDDVSVVAMEVASTSD
ncbi:MAG: SpoIIE family protein phosphatase [Phycisphaerae bacterium]